MRGVGEGRGDRPGLGAQVEVVHGLGDVQVAVGVEPAREVVALVFEVTLDLELGAELVAVAHLVLQPPAELLLHGRFAQIRDVADHPRHGQAGVGLECGVVVIAVVPGRVRVDRLPADLAQRDQHRAVVRGGRNRNRRLEALRMVGRPLQGLHAAHRAARHAQQPFDAQMVDQPDLRAHHVTDGDDRKAHPVGFAVCGIDVRRPGGPGAAAQHVAADDEEAVGIERLARADAVVPPARLGPVRGVMPGRVGVAAQRMRNQDGVRAFGVEPAVGFVRERDRPQAGAAVQREGFRLGEGELLRADQPDRTLRRHDVRSVAFPKRSAAPPRLSPGPRPAPGPGPTGCRRRLPGRRSAARNPG